MVWRATDGIAASCHQLALAVELLAELILSFVRVPLEVLLQVVAEAIGELGIKALRVSKGIWNSEVVHEY